MGYIVHDNVGGPDDVLTKIRDYAIDSGWTVLQNLTSDIAIDGSGVADGLRLTIQSPGGETYANFRSANGKKIFQSQQSANAYGIGLTCSADFVASPPSGFWYDQPGATKLISQEIIGVGIPVNPAGNTKLYLNHISNPAEIIVVSLEILPGYFQHMAVGEVLKIGSWTGGTIYSASRSSYYMFASGFSGSVIESGSNHLFSLSPSASTFLRCDIDAAPLRTPEVLWASSGPDTVGATTGYTGKLLGLPVMQQTCFANGAPLSWVPRIPHYAYLQSASSTDTGRNVNTLNCITTNLPLSVFVQRDPDGLRNFSQCGYVPGVYFISTRNVAPGSCYEISYPQSGQEHQAFPHTRRGGFFGYDGFSIKQ